MASVSFIHCADTHLGKIQQNLAQRFEDFLNSFNNLVDYAINEKVDFIIVAGDFFDKRNINPDTFSRTYVILKKLKKHDIPLIACEGNHDKTFYGNKLSWMETLAEIGYIVLLKPGYDEEGNIKPAAWNETEKKGFCYDITPEIRIFGLGYLGPEANNRLEEITPILAESKNNNKFNILLLHGIIKKYQSDFIGNISAKAANNLKNCCDYIALGHQHSKYEHENFAFNPGSLEYWDIQEVKHSADEKGFYHVKIDENKKIKLSFKPSYKRPAIYLQIDISGTKNPDDVYSLVDSRLKKEIQNNEDINEINKPLIRIVVKGRINYDVMEIDTKYLEEKIQKEFNSILVDINTERIQFSGKSGTVISHDMSREEIERRVINEYVEQSTRFEGQESEMSELVLGVMAEENSDEIYKIIMNSGIEKKKVELYVDEKEENDETEIKKTFSEQRGILDFS